MAIDRPSADVEQSRAADARPLPPPADTPGAEGFPSRAESRAFAAAAIDKIRQPADTGDSPDTSSAPEAADAVRAVDAAADRHSVSIDSASREATKSTDTAESGWSSANDMEGTEGEVGLRPGVNTALGGPGYVNPLDFDQPGDLPDDQAAAPDGPNVDFDPGGSDRHSADHSDNDQADQDGHADAPDAGKAPAGDGRADPSRGPADVRAGPHEELSPEERHKLDQHRADLAARDPQRYSDFQKDPDHLRTDGSYDIDDNARAEAQTGLDLRDRGSVTSDLQRPPGRGQGDFCSPSMGTYYDFKEVSSSPSFKAANFERKLADQFTKGRVPVIDTRNATQMNIDQIKEVIERRGWQKDVVWYP